MEKSEEKIDDFLADFFARIGLLAILILVVGAVVLFFYFKTPITADFLPLAILSLCILAIDLLISPGVFIVGVADSVLGLQMSEAHIFSWDLACSAVVFLIVLAAVGALREPEDTDEKSILKFLQACGVVIFVAFFAGLVFNKYFDTHLPTNVFNKYLKLDEKYDPLKRLER